MHPGWMAVCFLKSLMEVSLKTPWESIRSLLTFFFLLRGRRARLSFPDHSVADEGAFQSQHCRAETWLIAPEKSRFVPSHIGDGSACALLPSVIAVHALNIQQTRCRDNHTFAIARQCKHSQR